MTATDFHSTLDTDDGLGNKTQFETFPTFGKPHVAYEKNEFPVRRLPRAVAAQRARPPAVASAVASLAVRKEVKPKLLLRERTLEPFLGQKRDGTLVCTDGPVYARGTVSHIDSVETDQGRGRVAQVRPSSPFHVDISGRLLTPGSVTLPVAGPSGGDTLSAGGAVVIVCLDRGKAAMAVAERDVGTISAREADDMELDRVSRFERPRTSAASYEPSADVQRKRPFFLRLLRDPAHLLSVVNLTFCFLALASRQVVLHEARKISSAPGLFLDYPTLVGDFRNRSAMREAGAPLPEETLAALSMESNIRVLNAYGRRHPQILTDFQRLKQASVLSSYSAKATRVTVAALLVYLAARMLVRRVRGRRRAVPVSPKPRLRRDTGRNAGWPAGQARAKVARNPQISDLFGAVDILLVQKTAQARS
ncbi:hypothetical protein NCLIV_006560 [Neospora caninum Liverpool]|uniref:Uncharacterized protein n=1 Tax=Neospora caninum (strain Liverpool) TaxID=572307 RepID=F0V8Y9_NEOCL|nr:hypothetical protein NCLIV_006560 [Neospora caninum Liverpool]CBZ50180.1 hypothetical protein NCLIV_006560 [Neospora caninum Liverpool]CEL64780.1 TPA: hypothetical protein BN1204_006560 [Neospora caninum Liverpool]|eukprot:XP_003880215.1 hypothetical protein NCLIV_006560 [Neospora caninum Liverpool]